MIMLNLLIALMGGSYERAKAEEKRAGHQQRAQILTDYEIQMDADNR